MRAALCILTILLISGCGAKQKTTYREREAAHVTRSYSYDLHSRNDINSSVRVTKWAITPVDPDKPSSYTDPQGNTHELNNAKIDLETSEEETKNNSTIDLSGKNQEEADYNKQARETDTNILRVPLPLTIGVGIALILGLLYFIRRKTY